MFQARNGRCVKPFYSPPTLLLRQAASALYFGYIAGWKKLPHWLAKARKTLPTAAGATGMGCIGFPVHPVWEVTSTCNLKCAQCHAGSGRPADGELTTEEGRRLLEGIARIPEFRMLALGGGEPLARPDIIDLVGYARHLGLEISIATNGTLLTAEMAREFRRMGVANIAIGLNANDKNIHEQITRVPGSFEKSLNGIYATKQAGMALQINTTVMKENLEAIPGLLEFASEVDAEIVLLYQLVPEGRGSKEMELSTRQYLSLLEMVKEKQIQCRAVIEPTCSPQYWAFLMEQKWSDGKGKIPAPAVRLARALFKGCVAGSGLCYIKPDGDVWPCPFVPVSGGNVREKPLDEIWYHAPVFQNLRERERLTGVKCRICRHRDICGGCRGRAYAHYGDYLADDPLCFFNSEVSSSTDFLDWPSRCKV